MGTRAAPRHLMLVHLVPWLLLLLPLSRSASVVTHLPGFHGRLPFYLEIGYVGVEEETGAELFYYFVESERNPDADPVILWLLGGPGCSGFSGMVYEVGPMNFVLAPYNGSLPQLVYDPNSWTKVASIIFLDTPVGVGFSYARDPKGYDVGDISSSLQVVAFLRKWFNDHPRYLSNPFYIGGTSYAGMQTPIIAQYISEGNEQRKQPGINLKGYLVGNPITGSRFDRNFRVQSSHGFGIISDQIYELISQVDEGNVLDDKCVRLAPKPVNAASRNRFLSEEYIQLSEPSPRPTMNCFSYRYYLANIWANDNATRDALRVRQGTTGEWVRCIKGFPYTFDVPNSLKYHFNLTTRGYRALVFSGDHDLVAPFLGTQAWIRSFNFSVVDDWRAWHVDGQAAGFTIAYANNMTFATLKGGGHTALTYRPKQGFAMGKRWLDNQPL